MATIAELKEKEYNKEFYEAEEKNMLKSLEVNPEHAHRDHKYLGIIYGFMHRHEDFIYHAEKAIETAKRIKDKADTRVIIARSHIYRDEINTAIGHYLTAHEEDKEHEVIIEELAHCYKHLKEYDHALHWYEVLSDMEDREADAYNFMGDLYSDKEEYETAIAKYMQALTFEENDIDALHGIGVSYAQLDKKEEAMTYFVKEKELYPESVNALYCIGLLYQKQEDYYRALHHYTEALKIDPSFPEVYNNIAAVYIEMDGDFKAAIVELEKAAELATEKQQKIHFYMGLSRLYSKIKEDEKHEYWKKKLMDEIGFTAFFAEEDGDEDEGDIL